MSDVGLLEEMACPTCGQSDLLEIQVQTLAIVRNTGAVMEGDCEWGDDSVCICPVCGHEGTVQTFTRPVEGDH